MADPRAAVDLLRGWMGAPSAGAAASSVFHADGTGAAAVLPRPRRVLLRWMSQGTWAILDQGLFSVSNFALNLMLARWLSPQDYGAFTVAYAVFLFAGAVHFAVLTEPMLVFGPAKYAARRSEYVKTLVCGHWACTAPPSAALMLAGAALAAWRPGPLLSALLGLGIAGPCILLTWLLRRACYLRSEPRLAACAGLLYLALMAVGLAALSRQHWLSMCSALALVAGASVGTSVWLGSRLGIPLWPTRGPSMVAEIARDHWRYGRWAAATTAIMWATTGGEAYFLLLPVWHGLDATGTLKALANLITPLRSTLVALSILILPALARVRETGAFRSLVSIASVVFIGASAAYWGPVLLCQRPLLAWMYGQRYGGYAVALWFLGLSLLPAAAADVLGAALRALQRPDLVFRGNVAALVAALSFGLWAMVRWGVEGAAAGMAFSSACRAAAMWLYCRRQARGSLVPGNAGAVRPVL